MKKTELYDSNPDLSPSVVFDQKSCISPLSFAVGDHQGLWDGDPSGDQDQGDDAQQVGKHEEDLIGDGRTDDLLQTHLISIKSGKE